MSRLPLKRREQRHGQCEEFVPEKMPVTHEMRWYPTEVAVFAVFRGDSRLPPAVRDDVLESHSSKASLFLLLSGFFNKNHLQNIFFTAENVKFFREVAWVSQVYRYSKNRSDGREQRALNWQRRF